MCWDKAVRIRNLATRDLETLCDAETYIGTGAEQALDVARRARARYGA